MVQVALQRIHHTFGLSWPLSLPKQTPLVYILNVSHGIFLLGRNGLEEGYGGQSFQKKSGGVW